MVARQANQAEFLLQLNGTDVPLQVYQFEGRESISECYSLDITFVCEQGDLPLESLLKQPGCLTIVNGNASALRELDPEADNHRYIHGFVHQIRLLSQGDTLSRYQLTLVPQLRLLGHRGGFRIFQQLSVAEIIEAVFQDAGFLSNDYEFRLNQEYPAKDYCVQYDESELEFVQRLLADAGLHYHFEQTRAGTKLIIADSQSVFVPLEPLSYIPDAGLNPDTRRLSAFALNREVTSGAISVRDYDPARPSLLPEASTQGALANEHMLSRYFYPFDGLTQADASNTAKLRFEYLARDASVADARADFPGLYAGGVMPMAQHSKASWNANWLIFSVHHSGHQPQVLGALSDGASHYHNEVRLLPAETTFRPCPLPKPRLPNIDTAIVTGPDGEEIYCDEKGRVKVQFHWDREGEADENTSCWLNVSQAWAGKGYGRFVLPRIGHEVIVSFLHGDCDKPLITGSLHNGTNLPPYALPEHKTRTVIKTSSSLGQDNGHELRFEDKAGSEQIYLHSSGDMDVLVDNDRREQIMANQHLTVHQDMYSEVLADQHLTVGGSSYISSGADRHLSAESQDTDIKDSLLKKVGGAIHLKVGNSLVIKAGNEISLSGGGSLVKIDPGGVSLKGPLIKLNSGGSAGSIKGTSVATATPPQMPDSQGPGGVSEVRNPEEVVEPLPLEEYQSPEVHEAEAETGNTQSASQSPTSSDSASSDTSSTVSQPSAVPKADAGRQIQAIKQAAQKAQGLCEVCGEV